LAFVDQIAELGPRSLKFYGGNFEFYREQRRIERAAAEQTLVSAQQRLKEAKQIAQRARERQERRQSVSQKNAFKRNLPPIVAGNWKRGAEHTAARVKDRHAQKVDHARQEVTEARRNLPLEHQITVDLEPSRVPAHKRIVELLDVNYRYEGASGPLWDEPLNLEIIGPERANKIMFFWLKGPNGAGKSTLIDLICGRKHPAGGSVKVGTPRVALLDQRVSALDDSLTVLENLKRVNKIMFLARLRPEHKLRTLLGRFLFWRDAVFKPVAVLSGGERMRAGLACLLGGDQAPELLIADEPANNLDLPSLEEVAAALREFRGALIVVSHDLAFLEGVGVERVIELMPSRTCREEHPD
jgi:ATPase subunit of ABC transporter with duplicated ATPase domains